MRRWLILLTLLCVVSARGTAQFEEAVGDATGLDNVQLAVDTGSHTAPIRTLQFSRDGSLLYTFGYDRTVQVWNTATGQRERVLRMPLDLTVPVGGADVATAMALSPDDRTLAVYGGNRRRAGKSDGFVLLIDLSTSTFKSLESPLNLARLAWSPDGKRLVGTSPGLPGYPNKLTHVWEVTTSPKPRAPESNEARVTAVDFSRDGLLAVASADESVRIWDLDRDTFQAPLKHARPVTAVAWAPLGRRLATATGGAVHLWQVDPHRVLESFDPAALGPKCKEAKTVTVVSLQFLAFNRLLVGWRAVAQDGAVLGGTSILQPRPGGTGVEGYVGPVKNPLQLGVAASPDGNWVALVDGRRLVLWPISNPDKARILGDSPPFPSNLGWGPDTKAIAWSGDSRDPAFRNTLPPLTHALNLFDLSMQSGGEPIPNFTGPARRLRGWELRVKGQVVSASRNGEQLSELTGVPGTATLLPHGKGVRLALVEPNLAGVAVFDPETGNRLQRFPSRWGQVFRTVGSPDGRYLLSATQRLRLLIHSQETREHLLTLFVAGADWVAWTPQGYYAASPGGERMMGFAVQEKPDQLPRFHPASRFRTQLHRPDVIRLVLEKGSVQAALAAATSSRRGLAELRTLLPAQVKLELADVSKLPRQVRVRATASAAISEQPVVSLQLILDGRPAPVAKDRYAIDPPAQKGTSAVREWVLDVPPGSHRLAVLAQSPDSAALSEETTLEGPPAPPRAQGKLHLLCVGVSEYAHDGKGDENQGLNLKYAAKDAAELLTVFKGCQGDGKLFEPGAVTLLTNSQATSKAVLAELQKLVDASPDPGDLVVLHFSGHGERDDEGKLWLLTHEADRRKPLKETCLSGETLKDLLAEIPCRVLLILDACHSGALGRPSVSNDLTAMLADESCGVFVLVAARGREYALEGVKVPINGRETQLQNGLFTWALREALQGKARPDPYDSRVYTHHIYDHVFSEVRQWSGGKQHPYLGTPWGSKPLPLVWRDR